MTVPVGNAVAISTGVLANITGIVDANAEDTPLAEMDHGFYLANLTPSVTLCCNIPGEIGE